MTYFREKFTLMHNFHFLTSSDDKHKIPAAMSTLAGNQWGDSVGSVTDGSVNGAGAKCHTSNTNPYSLVIPYDCKLVRSAYSFMQFTTLVPFNFYWWKSDKDDEAKTSNTVWTLVDHKTCAGSGADINYAEDTWETGTVIHTSAVTFAAGDDFMFTTKRASGSASKTVKGSITHVFELLR